MIRSIRGFKDILPSETKLWEYVIKIIVKLFSDFSYSEIYTPILEKTELFKRGIGEKTDIVEKEMYTFLDNKGRSLTLRPEATASIVRAYIQHNMYSEDPIKRLFSFGPMFRRERPQKARFRQFYQMNVELLGVKSAYADAELIFMLYSLLDKLSFDDFFIRLNSLGCFYCVSKFKLYLSQFLSSVSSSLCTDCIRRKDRNPLRVLDCKNKSCNDVVYGIKGIDSFLCDECKKHFNDVIDLISLLNVPYEIDTCLVRGIDYYTRTVFEINHCKLGAKSAVAGGGRYDGLIKNLGGPNIPAIGFAIGFDRLIEVVAANVKSEKKSLNLYIAVLGKEAERVCFNWKMKFNIIGITVVMGQANQSLKSQMRKANRVNALYVIIVGKNEIDSNKVILRCMTSGIQVDIRLENIIAEVKNKIAV